jgi:hypothetical protein
LLIPRAFVERQHPLDEFDFFRKHAHSLSEGTPSFWRRTSHLRERRDDILGFFFATNLEILTSARGGLMLTDFLLTICFFSGGFVKAEAKTSQKNSCKTQAISHLING